MKKNKGYTLVEMIIVIAIIAILGGVSFITIGIIKESKRQSAVSELNNQMSSCLVRTKAVSTSTNSTSTPLCMVIKERTDGTYAIMTGYVNGSNITDSAGNALNPNKDENCEAVLSKEISKIEYQPATGQAWSGSDMIIQFIKSDGSTKYGGGSYVIYARKYGEKPYATISLDPVSGKHYVK
ncbi:MAG: prepilin-type N-terminal cleavage/methylation domain-containing protein [Clostridiales bacterium]|nr:prepilin-type N-terminal cleavage/methylation domain-containing protein [Clostridiales bacterium]